MTKIRTVIFIVAAGAVLAGCGGTNAAEDQTTRSNAPTESTTAPTESTAAPVESAVAPVHTGDADDNPACSLLQTADAEAAAGSHVAEINGTTTPGQYGDSHNCFWLPGAGEPTPSVAVQLETDLGSQHDTAVQDMQDLVDLGIGTVLDGVGDLAVTGPGIAKAVVGDDWVAVQVVSITDDGPSPERDQAALDLLREVVAALSA